MASVPTPFPGMAENVLSSDMEIGEPGGSDIESDEGQAVELLESLSEGSEYYSSGEEVDLQLLQNVLEGAYSTSKPVTPMDPAERNSLLLYDRDCLELPGAYVYIVLTETVMGIYPVLASSK